MYNSRCSLKIRYYVWPEDGSVKRAETCRLYNYHSLINISCVRRCRCISYFYDSLQHNGMETIQIKKCDEMPTVLNFK
jgi:hypothetical protein